MMPKSQHNQMWVGPEAYAGLDPGIRFPVKMLHAGGIETSQSCQGGPGHAYDRPSIDLPGRDAVGFAALSVLVEYGLPVEDIALLWSVDKRGLPSDRIWRITFSRPMPERADEAPMFVWSCRT